MVVVRRTRGGVYILAELDGTVSVTKFAAFRVIPYFPRTTIAIPELDDTISVIPKHVEQERMTPEGELDEE